MDAISRQEHARRLAIEAQEAIGRGAFAAALEAAGAAILHWPDWREPYCLIARICFRLGDRAMGETYLLLARDIPRPDEAGLTEDFYDDAALDRTAAQWRGEGSIDAAAERSSESGDGAAGVRIVAGGDVMLGRQMPGWVGLRGPSDPLSGIAPVLRSADVALVNLETCVSTEGDFLDKGGRQPYYYHTLPEMLDVLVEAGIGCVSTGNNHAMDFGAAALVQQTEILDQCGFLHFGAGRNRLEAASPRYVRVKGAVVALIGVETETLRMAAGDDSPGVHGVAAEDLPRLLAGAIVMARAHADLVVISPHWGENWTEAPTAAVRASARRLIELGADAILGHSAHVLHGVEFHLGRPIVYDMGTLLFDRVTQSRMKDSALFVLEWTDASIDLVIRPVKLANARARWAAGEDFVRIRDLLVRLSLALDPAATIDASADGLRLRGRPSPSPMRERLARLPWPGAAPDRRPRVPAELRGLKSNLLFERLPAIDGAWSFPVAVNPELEVLGARIATPVRPGRGFVCEVFFRAVAPAAPSRVEARLVGLNLAGEEAFGYTHPVAEGIHPPARWQWREVVCDRVVVRPVVVLAPGTYQLYWSLVDLEGGDAMPIQATHPRLANGRVHIGELTVSESAPNGVAGLKAALRLPRASASDAASYGGWQGAAKAFWEEQARPWVAGELAKAGLTIQSPEPVVASEGSWVFVVRVETEKGAYYFKALESHNFFEPSLLASLSAEWADRVPRPLAIRPERAWMLTPDCGSALSDIRDKGNREAIFQRVLAQLAEVQIDSCRKVDHWLALGVPDRRVHLLPGMLEELLADDDALSLGKPTGLQERERAHARRLLPALRSCCETLALEPGSAGLDHGDLHLRNVLVRDGESFLFDWDTAWVTHPFCSLLLPYHAEGLRDAASLDAMSRYADAYLAPWSTRTGRSPADLKRSLHSAIWVAHVIRALLWARVQRDREDGGPGQKETLVARWIRLWLKREALLMAGDPSSATAAPAMAPRRPPRLATAENPLLLDKAAIARLTGGTWHNVPDEALITGISYNRKYLAEGSSGNLYFALKADVKDESFGADSVAAVRKAIGIGAVAAVVPRTAEGLADDLPLLKVDHLLPALDQLGFHVRDHLFTGTRVLVSGTEGKTGFKNMLHHVLSPQISTHAVTNSANLGFGILASLASIRQHDRIAILEAAGTHPGRLAQRSLYVKPHLFVLTEVGNEHLNYHGSQQAVIESKADIVTGLVEGGYGLLNADSQNYEAVRTAVLARRRVPLVLFGSAPNCNGRLIDRRFEHNRWIVSADIEGRRVDYPLPLLGEHAPLASVAVLLAAYYLGANVEQAAADLVDYVPYESQGVLRRIAHQHGELLCYDNSSRASVLSYQSALRMAARLTPPSPQGRKVAVIGQMIFLGDESEAWHARLAAWIDEAGFDRLILVGKYTEATYAHLRHPDVVVRRFPEYDRRYSGRKELQALIDAVDEICEPGDLLFVKGEVDELGHSLQARQIKPAPAPVAPTSSPAVQGPSADPSALSGLKPIDLADLPRYRAAIDQTQRTVWQHYFPFFYLLGQTPGNRFLIDEDAGSICVYYLREKKGTQHLCLFVLPMPFQAAVLERCIERVKAFNRGDRASLFRVDAGDVEMFRRRPHTRIVACPEEYIYAPANYLDLSGNKKRNLRRAIQSMQRLEGLAVADYQASDAAECEQVLDRWGELQRERYGNVLYRGFTVNCLKLYDQIPRNDLFGKVIRLDGKICSFGFAGEMRRGMGNLFITYSDLDVDGLNKFLYYCLLRDMEHLEFANASHAGDTPGLVFAKQALGPTSLQQPFQVYAG